MPSNDLHRLDIPTELHDQIIDWQETYGHRTKVAALTEMLTVALGVTATDRAKVKTEQANRLERWGIKPPESGSRAAQARRAVQADEEPVPTNGASRA